MNRYKILAALMAIFLCEGTLSSCYDTETYGGHEETAVVTSMKLSATTFKVSCAGNTVLKVNIQAPTQPVCTTSESWLDLRVTEPSLINKVSTLTITVPANQSGNGRDGVITVNAGSETATITVSQSAGLLLSYNASLSSLPAEGGEFTIQTSAVNTPSVSVNASWISQVTDTRAGDMTSQTFRFTAQANRYEAREGAITFSTTESDGVVYAETVTICQEKGEVKPSSISATAREIAKDMAPGWNLGNTMEATGGETNWQPTRTTQALIDFVKAQGFKSVRIPCAWDNHSNASTGVIDATWMARVKEVVDYCINDGLYVELNDHWDQGWLEVLGFSKSSSEYQAVDEAWVSTKEARLRDLWTQIAQAFVDYDEHLIFGGLNEPFQEYSLFNGRHKDLMPLLIRYNNAFVETVRATGGNNSTRTLVIQGPSASMESALNYYSPSDFPEAAGALMFECHFYEPYTFCQLTEDASWASMTYFWGEQNLVSGSTHNSNSSNDDTFVRSRFAQMKTTFCDAGYPVLIGEYGALWRNIGDNQDQHNASIQFYHQTVCAEAVNNGMVPMVWDTNACSQPSDDVINRRTNTVWNAYAMQGIQDGIKAGNYPY